MDLSLLKSSKFIYADDLAIACPTNTFEEENYTLSSDLKVFNEYYKNWRSNQVILKCLRFILIIEKLINNY